MKTDYLPLKDKHHTIQNNDIWGTISPHMFFFDTIKTFLADPSYRRLLITTVIILIIGTVVFHFIEGWTWIESLYFSVITLTTIGYGDFSPQTEMGKVFTLIYILIGIGVILNFIQVVHLHYQKRRLDRDSKKNKK